MKKAVFLDRDGVITRERGYICPIGELEVFDYVKDAIKLIHDKGYLAIVITNQSGVAKGVFTEKDLQAVNNSMQSELDIDAVYYCPHYEGGMIPQFSIKCGCRKPNIGLIERARNQYGIIIEKSYMVGDRFSDILCGQKAGLKTVLLESGYGKQPGEDFFSDYNMKDLLEFAKWLK